MGLWSYSGADNAEVPKIIDKLTPAGKSIPRQTISMAVASIAGSRRAQVGCADGL